MYIRILCTSLPLRITEFHAKGIKKFVLCSKSAVKKIRTGQRKISIAIQAERIERAKHPNDTLCSLRNYFIFSLSLLHRNHFIFTFMCSIARQSTYIHREKRVSIFLEISFSLFIYFNPVFRNVNVYLCVCT